MKITITRAFDRKLQVKMYEPISFFCSATIEADEDDVREGNNVDWDKWRVEHSKFLDEFVQSEVEKSAAKFKKVDTKKSKDVSKESAELSVADELL